MNDVNPVLDTSAIEKIPGIQLLSSTEKSFAGESIQLIKTKIEVERVKKLKNIIYFPLTNNATFDLLINAFISPKTALLNQVNDAIKGMEVNWLEAFRRLKVKYCYTNDVLTLAQNIDEFMLNEICTQKVRYISHQNYRGMPISNAQMMLNKRLINHHNFENLIHLFELKSLD